MTPCYFDIQIKEDPLRLVFDIHQELIEIYNTILDKNIDGLVNRLGASFTYFRKIETHQKISEEEDSEDEEIIEQRASTNPGLFDEYWAHNLFGEYFGLGETIIKTKETKDFVSYEVLIPSGCDYDENQICPYCKGTKIDLLLDYLEMECCYCNGTGLTTISNELNIQLLADNLSLLCRMIEYLAYQEEELQSPTTKPLTFYVMLRNNGYAHQSIFGAYTKELADYIRFLVDNNLANDMATRICEQMAHAYSMMTKGKMNHEKIDRHEFMTKLEIRSEQKLGIGFLMQVPGENSCSIFSYSGSMPLIPCCPNLRQISGFTCHNIDSPIQQIPLLVGLATLNTATRKWLANDNED